MMELKIQRQLTQAFVMTMPVRLVLTPRSREQAAAGDTAWVDGPDRSEQILRLVEPNVPQMPSRNVDGIEYRVEFELLGPHDAAMETYDTFEHAGHRWQIIQMYPDNGYERRAEVIRYGR